MLQFNKCSVAGSDNPCFLGGGGLFAVGIRVGSRRPLGKQGVFAQVEPITPNKLGLPPRSLRCSPPIPSSLWYGLSFKMAGRIRGEPLLSNKQGSNGCLLRVQEPLCARKLNISDRQNGRWQITVALPRAIDWTAADF